MPRVIVTESAALGLERCRHFLAEKNRSAAIMAGQAIKKQFSRLETEPEIGRPVENHMQLRELVIAFGNTGYVALYHHDIDANCVLILAFRHQKEVGYG